MQNTPSGKADELLPDDKAAGRRKRWRLVLFWLLWGVLLAVWTIGLLSSTTPTVARAVVPDSATFTVGKVVHVGVYAILAALVCWLPARWGLRVWAWIGLAGHGALTEYLQQFVEGRSGRLADVGLDAGGVLLGLLVGLAVRRLGGRF
jgi:VanZ family protein